MTFVRADGTCATQAARRERVRQALLRPWALPLLQGHTRRPDQTAAPTGEYNMSAYGIE